MVQLDVASVSVENRVINIFVTSLKTSSALIGVNCTTWPCNNFACYTVAWCTFRMLHSYLVYISNVTHLN